MKSIHTTNMTNEIDNKIDEMIKKGNLKMRPKWYFILQGFLAVLGALFLFLLLIYVISFIIFVVFHTGVAFVTGFGPLGIRAFLFSFPWILVLVVVAFMAILEKLLKRYAFSYRQPIIYSAMGMMVIVVLGGVFLAQTSIHDVFLRHARKGDLSLQPIAGVFYKNYGAPHFTDIHLGVITLIDAQGFVMLDHDGDETARVFVTPDTRFDPSAGFSVGDTVVVLGEEGTSSATSSEASLATSSIDFFIKAFGIRKIK
ncbi:MAG: hypothetical protein PHF79_00660 [Candidatus Pacebacteria bacterium]|nr:hypothetical protein [Candidatus Paceibacterota bacterium]